MPRPNATAAKKILDRVAFPQASKSTTSRSEVSASRQTFDRTPMPPTNIRCSQPVTTFDQFMENTIDDDLDDPGCKPASRIHTRSMSSQQKHGPKGSSSEYKVNMSTNILIGESDGRPRSAKKHINFEEPKDSGKDGKSKKKCRSGGATGNESKLEKFDRALVSELSSRMQDPTPQGLASLNQTRSMNISDRNTGVRPSVSLSLKTTVSGSEIRGLLHSTLDLEFMEAVDKLAQADAACLFAGEVLAAEEAAANAPPELAEEAAAAGARDFHRSYQAQIVDTVDENVVPGTGCKPIEIIGYIGMTKPN